MKLGKDIATKIEKDDECGKFLKKENVKLQSGKMIGTWNGIHVVGQWLMSYFPSLDLTHLGYDEEVISSSHSSIDQSELPPSAADQSTQSKKPDESLCVGSLFVRYIMAYHYEEYKKLEDICEEISFQFAELETDRNVNLFARKDVKKQTFDKVVDDFIYFYQSQNRKMQQEIFPVSGKNMNNVIAETQTKFSVVIDFSQKSDKWSDKDSDKIIIYGKKEKVQEALKFLKDKKVDDSTGTTSSSSQPKGATGGSSSTATRGSNSAAGSSSPREKSTTVEKFSCVLFQNINVSVYQGDITKETVDVIVNSANERLHHSAGVAGAIVKAGGKSIQDESDEIMKKRRYYDVAPGQVVKTKAGNLPCNLIVHAVGPRWLNYASYEKDTAKNLLFSAVLNSLSIASQYGAKSISIPAISSGIFGVPVQICAEVLFKAATVFAKTAPGPLTDIRFVNIDKTTTQTFAEEMKKQFGSSVRQECFQVFHSTKDGSNAPVDQHIQRQFNAWEQNPISAANPSTVKVSYAGGHDLRPGSDNKGKEKIVKTSVC